MIEYVCRDCTGIFQSEKTKECQLCGAEFPIPLHVIVKVEED